MTEYQRPGKHTVRTGDTVSVSPAVLTRLGLDIKDPGWSGGKVLRFVQDNGTLLAEVTHPKRAATRTVDADRLTRMRGPK